ncbi:hypothetical protein [Saccharibacillus qingshengii]|uniref:hypothetical protein n=1 Tax=Saccharibacillus qingshengii TaxID=1763540 RepID=UPI001552FD1B|nr:hypothetical protein [Saccharibacillus qingshengii]
MKKGTVIKKGGDIVGHGGARKGAGRKPKGVRRKVNVNLPESDWAYIELLLAEKDITMSDYFKTVVDRTLTDDLRALNTTDLDPDDLLIL